jgi:hypothetical protein
MEGAVIADQRIVVLSRIAMLSAPLPVGERSTRIVRCAAGEGPFRGSGCVEKPLTRSLRWRSGFDLSPPGRGEKETLQPGHIGDE